MKFLIGIIRGVVLAGAGVTLASSNPFEAATATAAPQVVFALPAAVQKHLVAKRVLSLQGLQRQDQAPFRRCSHSTHQFTEALKPWSFG